MLPILLLFAVQDEPLGWTCSIERQVGDVTFYAQQSIEDRGRFPRTLKFRWMQDSWADNGFIEWSTLGSPVPGVPRTINFRVPLLKRQSNLTLRVTLSDGATEKIGRSAQASDMALNLSSDLGRPVASFQSLDRDINRKLWAARHFLAIVEDKKGNVLGSRSIDMPSDALVTRFDSELGSALDTKLNDAQTQCTPYGPEAYDPPIMRVRN